MSRQSSVSRTTKETTIKVALDLDGRGLSEARTGIGFFDHMLEQLGRHSGFDLRIEATGDLHVDMHHTVEDCGIALGSALKEALGEKRGINRFGYALVPLDEALAEVALDLSGRPYLRYQVSPGIGDVGEFPSGLAEEFMRAFTTSAQITLHVLLREGRDPHHCLESIFKALGRALREAASIERKDVDEIPSTKGVL